MKELNYLEILKKSLLLIWGNKILWLFGFFILLGSSGGNLVFNWKNTDTNLEIKLFEILTQNTLLLVMTILFALVILISLVALKIISQATIIAFTKEIKNEIPLKASVLFKKGKNYLWKLLLLELVFSLILFVLLTTLSLPVIFLVFAKSKVLAFFVSALALLIFIPVYILTYFVKKFSYMYIVLSGLDIKESAENAYAVFKANISKSLLFSLFLLGASMLVGLALFAIALVLGLPLILFGFVLSFVFSKNILYLLAGIGLMLLVILFILTKSALEAFNQVAWALFFRELAGIATKEEKESVPETQTNELAKPENA